MKYGAYVYELFGRSFDDAKAYCNTNFRSMILAAIATLMGAGAYGYMYGGERGADKFIWFLLPVAGMMVILVTLITVFFFFRTPFVLLREERAKSTGLTSSMESSRTEYEAELGAARAEAARAKKLDPKKNVLVAELQRLIERYRQTQRFAKMQDRRAMKDLYEADEAAKSLLQREFSSFTRFTQKYGYPRHYDNKTKYGPDEYDEVIRVCEDRLEALSELISHHQ